MQDIFLIFIFNLSLQDLSFLFKAPDVLRDFSHSSFVFIKHSSVIKL